MSFNFDFLPRMLANIYNVFGDKVTFKVVSELEEQQVLFVEDGNHGEYRPLADEFVESGIPFVRPPNLKDGRIDLDACQQINDVAFKRVRKGIGRGGDIVLTHNATIGRVAKTRDTDPTFVTNPQTTVWRALDREVIDPYYLYYFMKSSGFQEQLEAHKGRNATFDYVSLTKQRSLVLPVLDINLQRRIGSYLSCIDEKIFLNTKTNQTLEEMAQAIFKSWFVDFDPVKAKMNGEQPEGMDAATASLFPEKLVESELGLIPEGWEVGELSKLFELHRGFDLPKSKRQEGSFPVYAAGGYHGTHSEYKMEPPGIITGRSGVIGNVYLSLEKYWPLNTTLYVREFRACGPYYAYHLLRSLDLKSLNSGSAVPSLNRNFVHSTSVCHPAERILLKFEELVTPLFEKIVANKEQNNSLSELRDTLLPKLLSGEINLD